MSHSRLNTEPDQSTSSDQLDISNITSFVTSRIKQVRPSPIRAVNAAVGKKNIERVNSGFEKIPNLSMGKPDYAPYMGIISKIAEKWEEIKNYSADKLREFTGYQPAQGRKITIDKIVKVSNKRYKDSSLSAENAMMFNGATHFVATVFNALKSEINGEKVKIAVFAPHYPNHKDQAELFDKKFAPIYVQKGETPAQALQRVIDTNRFGGVNLISGLLLSYPGNPLGNCFSKKELTEILDVVKDQKNEGMLLAVERVYDDIAESPDDIIFPLDIYPKLYNDTPYLEVKSLAKGSSLPGFHIGYGFATKEILDVLKGISHLGINAVGVASEIVLGCVIDLDLSGQLEEWKKGMREHYMGNVALLVDNPPRGFSVYKGFDKQRHGSFYVPLGAPDWIGKNIPDNVTHRLGNKERKITGISNRLNKKIFENGEDIAKFLLQAEIAAVVPLEVFGLDEPYFRVSCAVNPQVLEQAIGCMALSNMAVAAGHDVVLPFDDKGQVVEGRVADLLSKNEGKSASKTADNRNESLRVL